MANQHLLENNSFLKRKKKSIAYVCAFSFQLQHAFPHFKHAQSPEQFRKPVTTCFWPRDSAFVCKMSSTTS